MVVDYLVVCFKKAKKTRSLTSDVMSRGENTRRSLQRGRGFYTRLPRGCIANEKCMHTIGEVMSRDSLVKNYW